MSSAHESSKPPAKQAEFGWPGGDRPGELRFEHAVSAELRAAIEKAIGPLREVLALTPPDGAIGRYAVTDPDGRERFVRVSARWSDPSLEQAMTRFLTMRGVPVNHLDEAGLPLEWQGTRLRVDVRQRLHGRHFDGSMADLQALAEALKKCHAALRDFRGATKVRELTAERFAKLEQTRVQMGEELQRGNFGFFCQEESWASENAEWLGELVSNFKARCDLLPESQCLHGEVHQGNVLFAPGPVLVDWERAVNTYAPVPWDLAYFVQRFCLHDSPGMDELHTRLQAVRAAYVAPLGDLCGMMRHVAWLSAVILVSYRQEGTQSPMVEYHKFVRLEEQARGMRGLLEEFAA